MWSTIRDIQFFIDQNYEISLPEGEVITELIEKSKQTSLTDEDYQRLYNFMEAHVYDPSEYHASLQIIRNSEPILYDFLEQIESMSWDWDIRFYKKYTIRMTLYGSGGSYRPNEGRIIIYTTKDGQFKKYQDPAYTLIHEIVHLCIEEVIIQHFNVPHGLKERIVDRMVVLCYGSNLPLYQVQNMGDSNLDTYFYKLEHLKTLPECIENYISQNK